MLETTWINRTAKVVTSGDLVHVTMYGAFTYEEFVQYLETLTKIRQHTKFLFIIGDVAAYEGVPDQRMRSYLASWTKKYTFSGMAIYGVSLPLRVALMLVFNAVNLFRHGSAPLAFVKDEAAAQQWIAQRRAELQAAEHS